jgi:signal transduction histidine kinase
VTKEKSVLFIDDEEHILTALQRAFGGESYGIATTTSVDEAMDAIRQGNIKVVVCDQRMPGVSGVEFLRTVKEQYPDIVRILFTGYTDFSTVEEAINLSEAYRFITKPWNTQELKSIMHQAMERYDLVMENRRLFEITKTKNEELEVLNGKLKVMYEAQKDFTSTVSHELRTPLASVKTAIDILISGTPGEMNGDQMKILGKAERNVTRLKNLINEVLDLSKLESGKMEFNLKENNINDLIREVVDSQAPVAEQKGLYLKAELDKAVPGAAFDYEKIVQVFHNLIHNAVKFTKEGGITVSSQNRKERNYIGVCVKDTGIGIKEEHLLKIFDKFQQLGDPATRGEGGTGLGLSICKEIITRHGGKIWAESKRGEGTSLFFILPIQDRRKG